MNKIFDVIICAALLVLVSTLVFAGSSTVLYNSVGTTNVRVTTDGSGNAIANFTLWDSAAALTGMAIKAASTAAVVGDGSAVFQHSPNDALMGAPGATACASDTASCNFNQQHQRIAQRLSTAITALGSPFQAGASIANTAFGVNAQTTGGASTTGNIAANNTTAVVVKASAGTLYGAQVYGIGSAPAYLKIYNATSATCGSGTPVKRLMIPAADTAANGNGSNVAFGAQGIIFGTGITYCVTTGILDNDSNAPAASTFLVNLDWK